MKHIVLFMTAVLISTSVFAGGLNRIGGMGVRHGGTSGAIADDSSLFCYNPAGIINFGDTYADVTAEVVIPRFKIKDRLGVHQSSDKAFHLMPMIGFIQPIGEDVSIGLGITNPYGLGATFDRDIKNGIFRSDTLISLTNITPAIAVRLNDHLTLGLGLNIGYMMFKYQAPFDIDGLYLPIQTNSSGDGWGIGGTIGLEWKVTQELTLGLSYMTELKAHISGMTHIKGPLSLLKISDGYDSEFTFPSRFGGSISYKATDKLMLGFSGWWYGYSNAVNSMTLNFHDLPMKKTTKLSWEDNFSLHTGIRYEIKENWYVSGGVGYQTAAIPPERASQLTPDVTGWDIAGGIIYDTGDFNVNLHAIYGWGDLQSGRTEFEAETLTVGVSFNIFF